MPVNICGLAPLLQVFDMPASLAFYRDFLGFEVVQSHPGGDESEWVLMRLNGTELMLNTAFEKDSRPDSPDTERIEAHGDTIIYFGCPDVDATYTYLKEKNINVNEPKIAWYGMKQLYLKDPDGFSLCFQWPANE